MPPVSTSQRKAMFAAATGDSTLGIPQAVGKEFIAADTGGHLPRTAALERDKLKKRALAGTRPSKRKPRKFTRKESL